MLRPLLIVIGVGCLACLAADRPPICAGRIACRWPTGAEQFRPAPQAAADAMVNDLAARDDFAVEGARHYSPDRPPPTSVGSN